MGLGLGLIDCNENSVATNLFSRQNLGPGGLRNGTRSSEIPSPNSELAWQSGS